MSKKNLFSIGSIVNAAARHGMALTAMAGMAATVLLASCGGGTTDTASLGEQAQGRAEPLALRHRADDSLAAVLQRHGFTGRIEATLETRLKRKLDSKLADLGRLLFFDTAGGLHDDNTCAGCHAPAAGFGDTQSIAIGVDNNRLVGPNRAGPRNQRRSPSVVNTAFYPKLMWNGRFFAPNGDPFDNSQGFVFPPPEGVSAFPPNHPTIKQLLVAQAFIPPTELVEVAGFTGVTDLGQRFLQFNDGHGSPVPAADASGFRNEPIRQAVLARLNASAEYRKRFGKLFPEVRAGAPIDFSMFGRAIAEFEFTLVRANAPIDRYARGERDALTPSQERGALLFFGKGNCVACHAVGGQSNQMFSDFEMHVIGVPQLAPAFGVGSSNMVYDGPGENQDYGLEQISGNSNDRYKFRSSPLRNVALQPAFFHNGAFTRLEDAIRHHLDVNKSARNYDPRRAGVDRDLRHRLGPIEPVLARLDPLLSTPIALSEHEFDDLVAFVRDGLLDPQARPDSLCREIPKAVPSGRPLLNFEGCDSRDRRDSRDRD
ncbi:MAG: cytochrome c peroxidase [Burkholderiaceae bacterium]